MANPADMMPLPSRRTAVLAVAALTVSLGVGGAIQSIASTPAESKVTVPTGVGQSVTTRWTGTIPVGSNPQSTCAVPGTDDKHGVTLVVPPSTAARFRYSVTFQITWTPPVTETVADEVLTVSDPKGAKLGDSDGGTPQETITRNDIPGGRYGIQSCGYANVAPQPYTGTVTVTVLADKGARAAIPPIISRGLSFGAAVASDIQRSEGEPAVTTDGNGLIYTCGPSGFSNVADYAQVSTDGGDQFHLLGQAPRGQISTGEGGGDCALATAKQRNSQGQFALAYAGLGPLTNFSTFTSPDGGRTITGSPISESVPGVDRQWITFVDDKTAFLNYNQEALKMTVQKSVDGGLTYDSPGVVASTDSGRIGQIRSWIPPGKSAADAWIYFPYTSGVSVKLALSQDGGKSYHQCIVVNDGVDTSAGFAAADNDTAGNIYVTYAEKGGDRAAYLVSGKRENVANCTDKNKNPGFTSKVRLNRGNVATAVMPWVAAGGLPGRAAVAFYGTESKGDPDQGSFKASWNVYTSQTLDAFAPTPTIDMTKVTTHPNHYDSICLGGLGCDLSVPAGDRSLVDYFTIDYNKRTGKLVIVFSATAKRPGDAAGYVAAPLVVVQNGGPSNGGGMVSGRGRLRLTSPDPAGDAIAEYSAFAGARVNQSQLNNVDALDLVGNKAVEVRGAPDGGFTVKLRLRDLSTGALQTALQQTAGSELLWLFRFGNGFQSSAAQAHWTPAGGFGFGFDDYTTGRTAGGTIEIYPGAKTITGSVDQAAGYITLHVPKAYLRGLAGPTGPGQRPTEVKASFGTRFYDATAYTLASVTPAGQVESYLYPLDNAPSMDFTLMRATAS